MGLINGAATYTRFTIVETIPDDFHANVAVRFPKFMFRDVDSKTNPDKSVGWVHYENPLNTRFKFENVIHGDFIVVSMRIDRKSISPVLYKAQVNQKVADWKRENRGRVKAKAQTTESKDDKIPREELTRIREEVKTQMITAVAPQTTVFEMAWNFAESVVYFSSQARVPITEFIELFGTTFELTLNEVDVIVRTEDFIDRSPLDVVFEDLRPARFRG